jgi:hypothetical protein
MYLDEKQICSDCVGEALAMRQSLGAEPNKQAKNEGLRHIS